MTAIVKRLNRPNDRMAFVQLDKLSHETNMYVKQYYTVALIGLIMLIFIEDKIG